MTTDLTGLELRRALAKECGWKYEQVMDYWHEPGCQLRRTHVCVCDVAVDGGLAYKKRAFNGELPAYESDAKLSEELLDWVCRENGWRWDLSRTFLAAPNHFYCAILNNAEITFAGWGATPSEARARAILAALRSNGK